MANVETVGMNTISTPETIPGSDSGRRTLNSVVAADAPRSCDASMSDLSMPESPEYSRMSMNGKKSYTMPAVTATHALVTFNKLKTILTVYVRKSEFIHMGSMNSITNTNLPFSADELSASASGYAKRKQITVVRSATKNDRPITRMMFGRTKKCPKLANEKCPVPSVNA